MEFINDMLDLFYANKHLYKKIGGKTKGDNMAKTIDGDMVQRLKTRTPDRKRYLDAYAVMKALQEVDDYGDGVAFEVLSHAMRDVALIPTADVVEVIRCKDCVYHYNPLADCCGVPFVTTDEDFCSWGERRED